MFRSVDPSPRCAPSLPEYSIPQLLSLRHTELEGVEVHGPVCAAHSAISEGAGTRDQEFQVGLVHRHWFHFMGTREVVQNTVYLTNSSVVTVKCNVIIIGKNWSRLNKHVSKLLHQISL
jgi:hypothetical protein